jgi:hypothetical protein
MDRLEMAHVMCPLSLLSLRLFASVVETEYWWYELLRPGHKRGDAAIHLAQGTKMQRSFCEVKTAKLSRHQ